MMIGFYEMFILHLAYKNNSNKCCLLIFMKCSSFIKRTLFFYSLYLRIAVCISCTLLIRMTLSNSCSTRFILCARRRQLNAALLTQPRILKMKKYLLPNNINRNPALWSSIKQTIQSLLISYDPPKLEKFVLDMLANNGVAPEVSLTSLLSPPKVHSFS